MTFTLTLGWWAIPAVFTVLMLLWAFLWPTAHQGALVFVDLCAALASIAVFWAVAGFLK